MTSKSAAATIEARQKRELFMEQFTAGQASDTRQRLKTDWENKGDVKIQQKNLMRHLDRVQAAHNDALVARRQRLLELLQSEQQEYDRMLSGLAESDEQRRERLIRKARELRAQREEQKKVDMAARHDRQFRDRIDCLRQAESRLKVMQVADERFQQLDAAERRREELVEEELFFVQQAQEAQRNAIERDQKDLDEQYQRNERLKGDLDAQSAGNLLRKRLEQEQQERDNAEFYRLLHEERVEAAQKMLENRERAQNDAAEMMALNEELQRARKEDADRERAEDAAELDLVLADLAEEQKRRREEKHLRVLKDKAAMDDLLKQMAQEKEDDHALDKLWEEASAKQWAKREQEWGSDQSKRDALLRNVLIERRQQVLDKRAQEKADREAREREASEFRLAMQQKTDESAEEHRLRMERLRATQQYLDWQISQRHAEKEAERQAKINELTEQGALEALYRDRIAQELANLEAAKPDRYKSVPLLPPKSRNNPNL